MFGDVEGRNWSKVVNTSTVACCDVVTTWSNYPNKKFCEMVLNQKEESKLYTEISCY